MSRRAFTLAELVLVLIIMAAIGALVVPLVGGLEINDKSPEQIATEATMNTIRDVIMGTPSRPGAWADLGQRAEYFPRSPDHLLLEYASIKNLEVTGKAVYPSITEFDPVTKIGWRGPYLIGQSNVIDAWRHDIVMQIPDANANGTLDHEDLKFSRLVSFGEDGILSTDEGLVTPQGPETATARNPNERGDDVVLYLRITDPAP